MVQNFEPMILQQGDSVEIRLPAFFRDEGWADGIGAVQNEIRRCRFQTKPLKLVFSFNSCRWIDPFPLVSILLEVANALFLGLNVTICFPKPDAGPKQQEIGPYQESPNRMLYFLAQEGFLGCLERLNSGNLHFIGKPDGGWDVFKRLHVKPSYEDAECIPMHLFVLPREEEEGDFAKKSVETLLTGISSKLESKIAPHSQERLIHKLRVALQEALHNAQEHAYEQNSGPRLVAIYVRYRTGGVGLDSAGRKIFEQCLREEHRNCPRLDKVWLTTRPGCLEVFVLDRGIGMVRNFEKAGVPLGWKYKFKQVMHETFFAGHSTKPERQTRYGGLHLLHNLLSETGDYLRALEGGIWFGCGLPLFRSEAAATHSFTKGRATMKGFAMHLRLGWKDDTDYESKWLEFEQGEQSEVWPELRLNEDNCESSFRWFEKQTVFDERFGELRKYVSQGEWILWLVRQHRMKWDILDFIKRIIVPNALSETVLIIADIPNYEAETYVEALSGYKAGIADDWPTKFSHIILCTNRWRFAAVHYKKHENRHGFTSLHKKLTTLRIASPLINPKPRTFRLAIVRWLKWHDSRLLWDEVDKNREMFIPEHVSWGSDELGKPRSISGYLDFPLTTHNALCSAIFRGALTRILGVLPSQKIELYPLDRLSMTVLQEIHSSEIYEPAVNFPETWLALGSILVSGSTLKSSSSLPLDLHFLIHRSSPLRGEKPALLFWLPRQCVNEMPSRLARIGKTAAIAPDGWKSFELPRFDAAGNCFGARTPQDTYQDWQNLSPVIAKVGHWSYEGHHDLLTVNIAGAVEAAFLAKNELARFLVSRILPFIGLNKLHLDENWHRLLDDPESSHQVGDPDDSGILVYRSHHSSDSVMHRLMALLTPLGRELAATRVFPILPIRMRWSGSTFLIPPLVREQIRKSLHEKGRARPVLVFDDAAITGRTINDLKTVLCAIGAIQIKTVVIANRLRQPAEGCDKKSLEYYWRFDVPVIGQEGNCPLCHALNLADAFSTSLAASNAKWEIVEWRRRWGATSPLNNWSLGLRPLPLESQGEKKFCYRQNLNSNSEEGRYLTKIDLIRSTGLAIQVTELHAMTGKDDYCFKKISEQSEPEIRVELAASQLLLFGNEFDQNMRVELVKTLITELARLKEDSPHAPLAALAIIGGLSLLDLVSKHEAARVVHNTGLDFRSNYSTKVLLAYLVSERLLEAGSFPSKIGKSLLTTSSLPLAQRFKAWFLEILSPLGNAHSEAIPLLIYELSQPAGIKGVRIKDALDSLDFLADLIEGLQSIFVRKEALGKFSGEKEKMTACANAARDILSRGFPAVLPPGWRQNAKSALEEYVTAVKSIADAFFHRIPLAYEYWEGRTFETIALKQIISRIDWKKASGEKSYAGKTLDTGDRTIELSLAGKINFDSNAGEIWIAWHRPITGILLDLLRNAVYAPVPIPDPWDMLQQKQAHMWLRVDYGKESADLIMANAAPCDPNHIFPTLKEHRWSPLFDIGGTVEPVEMQQGTFGVRVRIPYAAYLGS
jgi:hypothetical protein